MALIVSLGLTRDRFSWGW